jgi:hypothetical protein
MAESSLLWLIFILLPKLSSSSGYQRVLGVQMSGQLDTIKGRAITTISTLRKESYLFQTVAFLPNIKIVNNS